jgi:hypothetical protein
LVVGEVVEKGEAERLPLGRREPVHRSAHRVLSIGLPGGFGRLIAGVPDLLEYPVGGIGVEPRPSASRPKLVEDPVVGDLEEPRPEGSPRRIESLRPAPDGEEHVLHDFFGRAGVEALQGHVKHERSVAREKRLQGLGPVARQLLHALLVAGSLGRSRELFCFCHTKTSHQKLLHRERRVGFMK